MGGARGKQRSSIELTEYLMNSREFSPPRISIVAIVCGVALPDDAVDNALSEPDRGPATAIGNMRDIIEGRPSELETEIDAIIELARTAGVEVPHRVFLYANVRERDVLRLFNSGLKPPPHLCL